MFLAAACGSSSDDDASKAKGPQTYAVNSDANDASLGLPAPEFVLAYYPKALSVHPGDTVSFGLNDSGEPHTVALGTLVALLQDDVRVHQSPRSTGGALGMRASPPRGTPGRPATTLRAYLGDPVVFRTLVPGTNDVHTFFAQGHHFRTEPWSRTSTPVSALHVGISERFDVAVPAAGGDARRPGDYLFGDGRTSKLREGVWGVLRVLGSTSPRSTSRCRCSTAGRARRSCRPRSWLWPVARPSRSSR